MSLYLAQLDLDTYVYILIAISVVFGLFGRHFLGGGIKKTYDRTPAHQQVDDLAQFKKIDHSFYENTTLEATLNGFHHLEDYVDPSAPKGLGLRRTPVRVLQSEEKAIVVAMFDLVPAGLNGLILTCLGKRHNRGIDVETQLSNGDWIITTTSPPSQKTEGMEWLNKDSVLATTDVVTLVKWHKVRLHKHLELNPTLQVERPDSIDDIHKSQTAQHERVADVWRAADWKMSKDEYKRVQNGSRVTVITDEMIAKVPEVSNPLAEASEVEAETAGPAEWHFSINGENKGPVTKTHLREVLNRPGVSAKSILAWKAGMDNWLPAEQIPELTVTPTSSPPPLTPPASSVNSSAAGVYQTPASFTSDSSPSYANDPSIFKGYPGMGRKGYAIWNILILPALAILELWMDTTEDYSFLSGAVGWFYIICWVLVLGSRIKNLTMSGYWFWANFVPGLNLWLYYRCYCCPGGYDEYKIKDKAAKILTVIYWGVTILFTAAFIWGIIYFFNMSPEQMEQFDQFLDKIAPADDYSDDELYGDEYYDDLYPEETPEVESP